MRRLTTAVCALRQCGRQQGQPPLTCTPPRHCSVHPPSPTLLPLRRSFTQHLAHHNNLDSLDSPLPLPSAPPLFHSTTPPSPPPPSPSPSSPTPPPFTRTTRIPHPFPLSLHSQPLPYLDVTWSIVGNPVGPTIFIFPSMSHSALVTRPHHIRHPPPPSSSPSPSSPPSLTPPPTPPGWWESVVGWGEQYGIDLNTFNVLSASALGAPFGTSSPLSPSPHSPSFPPSPYRSSFPLITPLDQARCHHALLHHLTLHPNLLPPPFPPLSLPLYAVIGSSMGGMAAIHFSTSFPSTHRRGVLICTTPLTSPSTQALRSTQRAAVRMDPLYLAGHYPPHSPPIAGLRLARMMGTICYRSRLEFDQRFSPHVEDGGRFPVERYLDHVGYAFGGRFDANCYLLLSEAMDRMDVGQAGGGEGGGGGGGEEDGWSGSGGGGGRVGLEEAVRRVGKESEWMVLPVTEDALIPAEESDRWASLLGEAGVRVHHERVSSKYGHDAFLKEGEMLNPRLSAFLTGGRAEVSGVQSVRKFVNELYGA